MTDEELKAALTEIVRDADATPESMGPPDEFWTHVPVALVRAMLERLP